MSWLEKRWYSDRPAPIWLRPLECLYRSLAKRNENKAKSESWKPEVPVIIVGNISVGGTGKTPLVVFLVEYLRDLGYKPGIISRGYKSKAPHYPYVVDQISTAEEAGDEPFLIHNRCHCPVVIDADRQAAAKCLLDTFDCDLIISDDGLQHHRLGRDIEIVVIDGERGLGNQHCLPAGPLREPAQRLQSVDLIVSNGELVSELPVSKNVFTMNLEPSRFISCFEQQTAGLDVFAGQQVHAIAGIGNPDRFFTTLEKQLGVIAQKHPMPDHYEYCSEEITFDDDLAVLMTEKDAAKIRGIANTKHWYLEVSATLSEEFKAQLSDKLSSLKIEKGN